MAQSDFYIKTGDTGPALRRTLLDTSGDAEDLTGATVAFHMESTDGVVVVDGSATLVDAANGVVQYEWQSGDTDESGTFFGEFEVTFSDGIVQSYPNDGDIRIGVVDDIA